MYAHKKGNPKKRGLYLLLRIKSETTIFSLLILLMCILLDYAQKMKFSIKDFFSKFDQIRRKLRIWSYLLNKSLIENFIVCIVLVYFYTQKKGNTKKRGFYFFLRIKCETTTFFHSLCISHTSIVLRIIESPGGEGGEGECLQI